MTEELALLRSNLAGRGESGDMPARLGGAYDAFEYVLAALEAGPVLTASVMAASHAAEGRNELDLAPSLLPIYRAFPGLYAPASVEPVATSELAALCRDLADLLWRTATSAPDIRDQAACRAACESARRIEALMVSKVQ